jgi:hypothetical protein
MINTGDQKIISPLQNMKADLLLLPARH